MVIITDCNYRSSIAAIYSLVELKEEIIGVTTDESPCPPAFHSRYLKKTYVLSSNKDEYKEELLKLCSSFERPVLLPIGVFTLDIISNNLDVFNAVCDFSVSDSKTLQIINDKSKAKEIASSVGIKVPRIYNDESPIFPSVVKPVCGEKFGLKASQRYKIVHNEQELNDAKKLYSFSKTVTEEYVHGGGVGVSLVMGRDGAPYTAFCHKRLSEYPASGGPSSSLITFYDSDIIDKSIKLLQSVSFSGIAMVEYKEKDGEYYFLEVNPRIWGSFGATYKAKSDFIKAYVEASKKREYTFSPKYKRGKKVKFLPNILASVISYVKIKSYKKAFITGLDAINPFVQNAIFSIKDPLPSLRDIFRKRR